MTAAQTIKTKKKGLLILTAIMQVTLSSMNLIFLTKGLIVATAITGFFVTFIWTINVKKMAFGNIWDRVLYSAGAVIGMGTGFYVARFVETLIKN